MAMLLCTTACDQKAAVGPDGLRTHPSENAYIRGMQAYDKGNRAQAEADLREAVKDDKALTMGHIMLGQIFREDKHFAEAAKEYEVATELDPYTASNHYYLGLMYHLLNRLQEAAKCYLKALMYDPNDFNSNMNLGTIYIVQKNEDSVKYARRATEVNPKSAAAWANLGTALDAQKQYVDAERAYRQSIELDSKQMQIQMALARNLLHQPNRANEARSTMAEVIRHEDTPTAHCLYGEALFADHHYDQAIAEYQTAINQDPGYCKAMNELGWAKITQYDASLGLDDGKRQEALDWWQKSLDANPDQPQIKDLIHQHSAASAQPKP